MDKVEHMIVAALVAVLYAAFIKWAPFPLNAALCAGVAMLLTEFKESQAKLWYDPEPIFGWENVKLAFKRTFGLGNDKEALDTFLDWFFPLTFLIIAGILLVDKI